MTDHVSKKQIEAFCAHALEVFEMVAIAEHMDSCDVCHHKYREVSQKGKENKSFSISLDAEDLLKNEHLDNDQLLSLIENKLEAEALEIVYIHLKACPRCREDVRSLVEFRRKTEPDLNVRFEPDPKES
jgi:anti-sigma factor ChrR (cupin superfamily)